MVGSDEPERTISPILNQLDPANSLTLMGLVLGFTAVIFAWNQNYELAAICIIFSGLVDLFDGVVARQITRTDLQKGVGQQLDSLVDLCSFGFAPAAFAYSYGLRDPGSIAILLIYLCANALRLAYFNCTGLTQSENQEFFTGLPVTYAALFIPLAFTSSLVMSKEVTAIALRLIYSALAVAMISNFKMVKLKGVWYGVFAVGAAMMTGLYAWAFWANG